MTLAFTKYFIHHILSSFRRGNILFLAVLGLVLSSFALIVLQSVMGGLQRNLMGRSKRIVGSGVFYFHHSVEKSKTKALLDVAEKMNFRPIVEYELELLVKNGETLVAAVVHAIDTKKKPSFLDGIVINDLAVPFGLSFGLGAKEGHRLLLMSPSHVDSFMEDIPRSVSTIVSHIFTTHVPELDETHLWARMGVIHNLIKAETVNTVRFYGQGDWDGLVRITNDGPYRELGRLLKWEEVNKTLVWALRLESNVMIFLFTAMALMVSLCVTSGLMIFFDKIKNDMVGLWILGASKRALYRASSLFVFLMSFFSSLSGLLLGLVFLFFFDRYAPEMLPTVFVDRKIPVAVDLRGCLTAFFIPFFISFLFGRFSLGRFKEQIEGNLRQLRNSSL